MAGIGDIDQDYNEELDSSSGCDMSFEYSSDNLHVTSPPSTKNYLFRRLDLSPSEKPLNRRLELSSSPPRNYTAPKLFLTTPKAQIPRRLDLTPKKPHSLSKLMLNLSPQENNNEGYMEHNIPNFKNPSLSPPYKRVIALKLFDSPLTPKTILAKSATTPLPRHCLFQSCDKPKPVASSYDNKPSANVNPFTPSSMLLTKKRTRSIRSLGGSPEIVIPRFNLNDSDTDDMEIEQPTKRIAIQESNISRYNKEFHEVCLIGSGQFGSVYKCINRLDGLAYAVKKSIRPVAGSFLEKRALNEVYAHAVLGIHQHVVRYYSAWAEDNHMIIQNEFCDGGALADEIDNEVLSLSQLRRLTTHIAEGLRYIHSVGLVHLDIKPANIFISKETPTHYIDYDSADDDFYGVDDQHSDDEEVTYKIGDLGHVTSINKPEVEEGDCRYLPSEILREEFNYLPKADIFSLGLTLMEAAGSGPLPKNGDQWLKIREGQIPKLKQQLTKDFVELLKSMIHPDPTQRPTLVQILQHKALIPAGRKSKAELHRELNAERLKNEILSKQLLEAAKCIKSLTPETSQLKGTRHSSRLIGKKYTRSVSSTNF